VFLGTTVFGGNRGCDSAGGIEKRSSYAHAG
jgi:hypothetical protein